MLDMSGSEHITIKPADVLTQCFTSESGSDDRNFWVSWVENLTAYVMLVVE